MPEYDTNKKERTLGREVTTSPSSDEAIVTTIKELTNEIRGLPNPPVVVEGDSYPPKSLADISGDVSANKPPEEKIIDFSQLAANRSARGLAIRNTRLVRLKKKTA